jgi:hypothetical protein
MSVNTILCCLPINLSVKGGGQALVPGCLQSFDDAQPSDGLIAFGLRGEKIEISCANGAELRDNYLNIGGLAFWDGIERMDRNDQFEAEAIAAVSKPEYFALQRLPNRILNRPPISSHEVPRRGMQSAYTIIWH